MILTYKSDDLNFKLIFIGHVMIYMWSPSAPPPTGDEHHSWHIIDLHCLTFYEWISSTLYPISSITELYYCGVLQYFFADLNLIATEHFEYIASYGKDCKLVNSIEEWVLYNVLNGNYIGLFLYLTHSIKTFCKIILQSACRFDCEIQCCDISMKWILSLQILYW